MEKLPITSRSIVPFSLSFFLSLALSPLDRRTLCVNVKKFKRRIRKHEFKYKWNIIFRFIQHTRLTILGVYNKCTRDAPVTTSTAFARSHLVTYTQ